MNTSVEFFEWLLHTENEENIGVIGDDDEGPCRLGPPPSMVSFSDSELSSLESDDAETASLCSSNDCATGLDKLSSHQHMASLLDDGARRRPPPRRVSFQHVEVREYSITVGDHPFCYDGLPLTLDWEHADSVEIRAIDSSRERRGNYRAPRRLSFDERRDRLFRMAGSSSSDGASSGVEGGENGENDRALELGLIIKMLHNSWSMNSILPPPVLYDIEEDDDDDDDDVDVAQEASSAGPVRSSRRKGKTSSKKAQAEQVVEWKRIPFRRSNAFSE